MDSQTKPLEPIPSPTARVLIWAAALVQIAVLLVICFRGLPK